MKPRNKTTRSTKLFSLLVGALAFVLTYNVYFIMLRRFGIHAPAYYEAAAVFTRDVEMTFLVMIVSTVVVILVFGLLIKSFKKIIRIEHMTTDFDRIDATVLLILLIWLVVPPIVSYFIYTTFTNSILSLVFVLWFVYPSSLAMVIFSVMFLLMKVEPRLKKRSQASRKQSGT
ncbi:MAG: hypothetical protein ABIH52_04000 [Candidatus Aenigmatarchaeota archaeon]